ncbi:MAG TPA: copper-binding protein [Candidatus Kapabacteria bacterium]|nr:copper-binding protein [Candidatus Kapabacteria bacterium]
MKKNQVFYVVMLAFAPMMLGSCGKSTKKETPALDTGQVSQTPSAANSTKETEKIYTVFARVTAIDEKNGAITIDHEKIEGYMGAMEMPYAVANPAIFKEIKVGSKGHFTIRVREGNGEITSVHVHSK